MEKEKQDILNMLDSLDVQISMGKIDQTTYAGLRQKWLQKLQELEATGMVTPTNPLSSPLSGTSSQLATAPSKPVMEILACPACGARAEIDSVAQDLTKPMQCSYCQTVYTQRQSEDNAQKLKQELKAWLDQMTDQMTVRSGPSNSGAIDVQTRRFIFSEKLYPTLKKDVDRRLEAIENAAESSLVPLKMLTSFQDYQPNPQLAVVGQGDNQWLKTLITRVSDQQLQDFAMAEEDKNRLKLLHIRVLSLVYYANIAHHLTTPDVPSYQVIRQNLLALQKAYQEHTNGVVDEIYRSYTVALDSRVSGAVLLLDILISTLGQQRGVPPEAVSEQLERALTQLKKAEQQALACTYNPLYSVPLQQGIQKDITVALTFRAVVKCYETITRVQPIEFEPFYEHLMHYTSALVHMQSPDHLLGLLQSIVRLLAARSGDDPISVLMDWSWLDAIVKNQRIKGTFGIGGEKVKVEEPHLQPYWVATLNYAEKGGHFIKSVTSRSGLILADATSTQAPMVGHLLVNDPNLPAIQTGINTFNLLDKEIIALPALVSQNMAEKAMKAYANERTPELGATIVKMIGLMYLPCAFVRYVAKNGTQREIIVSRLNFVNQELGNALSQTHRFLRQYRA